MRKKIKLLIFGDENCGLVHNLAAGFREIGGYKITTAICQYDPFFSKFTYDYNFKRPERSSGNKYISKIRNIFDIVSWKIKLYYFESSKYYNFDLYIFTWQTLKPDYSDLKILRNKGKKVVFLYIGSNVRWIDAFHQEYPGNPYKGHSNEDWVNKFKLIRMGELYASSIFSVPDQSTLFIRGYYHMFMPVDLKRITHSPSAKVRPLIIHAPSKRDIKGTAIILDALDKLKAEGLQFDFELLENMDNDAVLRKLEEADILVDQLYLHGPATLCTEAIAAGCAVAARYFKEYPLTSGAPVYYIDEKNVVERLRELITNVALREIMVKNGRIYVEEHNSFKSMAMKIIESIDRDIKGDYDYKPVFFRTKFHLPETYSYPAEIEELNQLVLEKYSK